MHAPIETFTTLVTLFGSLLGLVVAAVLLVYNRKAQLRSNYLLVALMTGVSLSGLLAAVTFSGWILSVPHLFRVSSPLHYATSALLYYYTKASIYRHYRFKAWEWLLLLPAGVHLLEMMPVYLLERPQKIAHIRYLLEVKKDVTYPLHNILKNGYAILLTGLSLLVYLMFRREARREHFPQNSVHNRWLVFLFANGGAYGLVWLLKFLFPSAIPGSAFTYNSLFSAVEHMVAALFLLFCPQILYGSLYEKPATDPLPESRLGPAAPEPIPQLAQTPPKYKSSPLTPAQKATYFEHLQTYMAGRKPYLDKQLSLQQTAIDLDLSPHHLSQVINERGGCSFTDYVNGYRVQFAQSLLSSGKLNHLSIAGIGSESGFNSRATFYKAFKKFTGMTPTEYASHLGTAASSAA